VKARQRLEILRKDLRRKTFSAYVEWDPESKLYVGIIPGIPGAQTQAALECGSASYHAFWGGFHGGSFAAALQGASRILSEVS